MGVDADGNSKHGSKTMASMTTTQYHGGSDTRDRGYLWVTSDRDYAESYGEVFEVDVSADLNVLDLSDVACDDETDMDMDEMQELLDDAGIDFDAASVRVPEPQYVAYAIAGLARAAGFEAIRINEWTYGVGATESTMLLY